MSSYYIKGIQINIANYSNLYADCFLNFNRFVCSKNSRGIQITFTRLIALIVCFFQVYLADSTLVIEVEKDYTVYGDELKFGGGKVKYCFMCVIFID